MPERRSEPRRTFVSRVEVRWIDEEGAARRANGIIEDRSASGIGMRLNKPIPVGTALEIKSKLVKLGGAVRRCIRDGYDYIVGVRLQKEG